MGSSGRKTAGLPNNSRGATLMDAWRLENAQASAAGLPENHASVNAATSTPKSRTARNALLSGTALGVVGAAVVAGAVMAPTAASAADWGNKVTNNTAGDANYRVFTNNGSDVGLVINGEVTGAGAANNGASGTSRRNAIVTNNGSVTSSASSNQNGVDVTGHNSSTPFVGGTATYTGAGSVNGANSGVVLGSVDKRTSQIAL